MSKLLSNKHRATIRSYFGSYNFVGTIVGSVFMLSGFLPTLLPRGWILQAIICGVLFATGYGIGLIISHFYRRLNLPEPIKSTKRQVKQLALAMIPPAYLVMLILGFKWQQEVRQLVGQSPEYSFSIVGTIMVTVLLVMFIILIARSIRSLYTWLKNQISKRIPKPIAYTLAWLITAVLIVGILNGVILSAAIEGLNQAFSVKNGTTDAGITQPTDEHLSGSPESLINWETLGRQGRNFIGRVTTTQQLSDFSGSEPTQPIRIYSGLESAGDTKSRAELAAEDLKRAGGLDRKIIVVVTTTGTGWVDEQGVAPIEYMYNGDSALVSMQYSYLPSWLSFLVDQSKAKAAGTELYNAIYNEVLDLPESERPKVVVFGESLGSFGGESAFSGEANFRATSDGAVWAGPPNFNILRRTATANREPGSPEIRPIFHDGQTLRFAITADDFGQPDSKWDNPRAVYLQNASDPIVWWSPHLIYNKPDWLREPRGADVHKKTVWLPIITFWGVTGDMVFSTGVPDYHGHKYGTLPTDAWSYVAPPEGWTQEKTQALKAQLSQ